MKQKTRDIEPGELFFISSGEYSSYEITALFRCKRKFNPDDEVKPFIEMQVSGYKPGKLFEIFKERAFISHLVSSEILEVVPVFDFHVSCYGEYEPSIAEVGKNLI